MFDRFTPATRRVGVRAQDEARSFGHPWLGTEHLLLGVLAEPGARGASVLSDLGVTLDTGGSALRELVGTGGLCESDAEALRTLGIDLDEVRGWRRASHQARSITFRADGGAGSGAAAGASPQP